MYCGGSLVEKIRTRVYFVIQSAVFWNYNLRHVMSPGTKCKLPAECRLGRGNPKLPGILNLFSKPQLSQTNFLVDLKVQSTR
jgi:hypothetical protein